jgi:hypothetical protein
VYDYWGGGGFYALYCICTIITFLKSAKFGVAFHIHLYYISFVHKSTFHFVPCGHVLFCFHNWWSEWRWSVFTTSSSPRSVGPNRNASYQAQIQQFGAILSATVKELGRTVGVKLPFHFILWAVGFVRCVLFCRSKPSNNYADSYLSICVYCFGDPGDWKYICRFNFFQILCSRLIQYSIFSSNFTVNNKQQFVTLRCAVYLFRP